MKGTCRESERRAWPDGDTRIGRLVLRKSCNLIEKDRRRPRWKSNRLDFLKYPITPDGRYFVHRERLWRCTNPNLDEETRQRLVSELMTARREVAAARRSSDDNALAAARNKVHAAKVALGERGPTWWDDDRDYNRYLIKNTPYADWWSSRAM
ncbi:hypothetical protein RMSM_06477 [Rhodopirellula maiorica SM1]|uniref:Uncharacterized protein n=1 Tax=Rhodopirellula maiorica SM1 TaxID=1265738 RepID=M5RAT8_9BACT|nr:hypothetical protein RMSM_06477 [Rhodopirellula maiorica SM1]